MAVKVCLRVRPSSNRTSENFEFHETHVLDKDKNIEFEFDSIYEQDRKTIELQQEAVNPIIDAAIAGFHGTVFAYGQTGSGKTFTMSGTDQEMGVIPLSIHRLFDLISQDTSDRVYLLRVSYFEIYCERITDLLCTDRVQKFLEVKEENREPYVCGLSDEVVTCKEDVFDYLARGNLKRKTGATAMNEKSSRSHAVFRITVESKDSDGALTMAHLNLVDLAGSEKLGQTKAEGQRLKEGIEINQSLHQLNMVIMQVTQGREHVTYRNSKLTRILQNSIGGSAKTCIICTISPWDVEETLSTLRFGTKAKKIKNKEKKNEIVPEVAMIKRLECDMRKLEAEIQRLNSENVKLKQFGTSSDDVDKQKRQLENIRLFLLKGSHVVDQKKDKLKDRRVTCVGIPSMFARRCDSDSSPSSLMNPRFANRELPNFTELRKQPFVAEISAISDEDIICSSSSRPRPQTIPEEREEAVHECEDEYVFDSPVQTKTPEKPKEVRFSQRDEQILFSPDEKVNTPQTNECFETRRFQKTPTAFSTPYLVKQSNHIRQLVKRLLMSERQLSEPDKEKFAEVLEFEMMEVYVSKLNSSQVCDDLIDLEGSFVQAGKSVQSSLFNQDREAFSPLEEEDEENDSWSFAQSSQQPCLFDDKAPEDVESFPSKLAFEKDEKISRLQLKVQELMTRLELQEKEPESEEKLTVSDKVNVDNFPTDEKMKEMQQVIETLKAENKALKQELAEKSDNEDILEAKILESEELKQRIESMHADAVNERCEGNEQFETLKDNWEKKIVQVENRNEELVSENEKLTNKIEELVTENEKLTNENGLEGLKQNLDLKCFEIEELTGMVEQLKMEIGRLTEELTQGQADVTHWKEKIDELDCKNEESAKESTVVGVQTDQEQTDHFLSCGGNCEVKLQEAKAHFDAQMESYLMRHSEVEQAQTEMLVFVEEKRREAELEVENLEQKMKELESEMAEKIKDKEMELEGLKSDHDFKVNELTERLTASQVKLEGEIRDLKETCKFYEGMKDQACSAFTERENEVDELKRVVSEHEQEKENLQIKLEQSEKELVEVKNEMENMKQMHARQVEKFKREIRAFENELKDSEKSAKPKSFVWSEEVRAKLMKDDDERLLRNAKYIQAENKKQREEIGELKAELDKWKKDYEDLARINHDLRKRIPIGPLTEQETVAFDKMKQLYEEAFEHYARKKVECVRIRKDYEAEIKQQKLEIQELEIALKRKSATLRNPFRDRWLDEEEEPTFIDIESGTASENVDAEKSTNKGRTSIVSRPNSSVNSVLKSTENRRPSKITADQINRLPAEDENPAINFDLSFLN